MPAFDRVGFFGDQLFRERALPENPAPKFAPTLSRLLSKNRRRNNRRQLFDVLSERRFRVAVRNARRRQRRRTQASSDGSEDGRRRRRDVIVGAGDARLRQETWPDAVQLDGHPAEARQAAAADAVADLPPVLPRSLRLGNYSFSQCKRVF